MLKCTGTLTLKFEDVILNDNTAATNRYETALSLFLVVDNYLFSRLVAQALTDDKTKEAHAWILQQIKKATFDATLHVIFTNADPALIVAIRNEFPTTHAFNSGMSLTFWVKSYNAKIKRLIFNSNMTLLELAEKLSVCILNEDKKTEYALFCASISKTIQEDQIKQALQYHSVKIEKNVDLNLFGKNPNFTDITAKSMLELVDKDKIVEMWGIRHITNSTEEQFLVAQKFKIKQSIVMGWNSPVLYLNALVKEVPLIVAVRRNDYKFITILDKYINDNDYQEPLSDSDIDSSDSSSDEIDNRRLDPSELINPHKRKGKGR
ncbi:22510_t:CDS:2, partial [Gigaspora rosea]